MQHVLIVPGTLQPKYRDARRLAWAGGQILRRFRVIIADCLQARAEGLAVWPEMAELAESGQIFGLRQCGDIEFGIVLERRCAVRNARLIDALQQERACRRRLGKGKRSPRSTYQTGQQQAVRQSVYHLGCQAEYAFENLQYSSSPVAAEASFSHQRINSTLASKEKAERGAVIPLFIMCRVKAAAVVACVASAGLIGAIPPASADNLNEGAKAYSSGDFAGAANQWRPLAEAGDALAQFNLALLHDSAESGMFDSARAAAWYERAAQQGFAAAQVNLAAAYQNGRGVTKDTALALFWLLIASEAEDSAIGDRAAAAAQRIAALLSEKENIQAAEHAEKWQAKQETQTSVGGEQDDTPYMTLSEADVMTIQSRLKALGYDPGPIDGIAGEATQQALAAFFKDRGQEWRHGPLSHQLLEVLR